MITNVISLLLRKIGFVVNYRHRSYKWLDNFDNSARRLIYVEVWTEVENGVNLRNIALHVKSKTVLEHLTAAKRVGHDEVALLQTVLLIQTGDKSKVFCDVLGAILHGGDLSRSPFAFTVSAHIEREEVISVCCELLGYVGNPTAIVKESVNEQYDLCYFVFGPIIQNLIEIGTGAFLGI